MRPRFLRNRGQAEQEPDPSGSPDPTIVRASDPEPEPEPELQPEGTANPPREWNLWELERVAREHPSDDGAQNEERAYLLIYLRDFAGSDGTLPADFDGLVHDAFGDLLHVVAT